MGRQTVTGILDAYAAGTLPREEMLAAMRAFPWKDVKRGDPFSESAWENQDWPQAGTVQEVYSAVARGVISAGDRTAILDAVWPEAAVPSP